MGSPSGQDTNLSANTALTLLYSGTQDPTTTPIRAVAGTVFLGTGGTSAGKAWIKQDEGLTTNWSPLSEGSGVSSLQYRFMRWVDPLAGDDVTGNGSINKPFKTITACLASITDASNANRYVLLCAAGDYSAEGVIAWKDHCSALGFGEDTTRGVNISLTSGAGVTGRSDFVNLQGSLTVDLTASVNYNVRPINCIFTVVSRTSGANNLLFQDSVLDDVHVVTGGARANSGSVILNSLTVDDDPTAFWLQSGGMIQGVGSVSGQGQVYLFNVLVTAVFTGTVVGPNTPVYEADAVSFPLTPLNPAQWQIFRDTVSNNIANDSTVPGASVKEALDSIGQTLTFDSAASAGGAGAEALVVAGLLATDTILAVSQRVAGANNTAVTGFNTQIANGLTLTWSGDPGVGAIVKVTVKR